MCLDVKARHMYVGSGGSGGDLNTVICDKRLFYG